MALKLPSRFTRAWIERNVPFLSERDLALVLAAMRAKGWPEEQIADRVYPHVKRLPQEEARPAAPAGGAEAPAAPRRRRPRRPSLLEASYLAGIIGSIAAVVALFQPFTADEDARDGAPKSNSLPGRLPASDAGVEQALLEKIPAGVRATCSTDEDLRKQFVASAQYSCQLAGVDQVVYFKFRTADAMARAYQGTPRDVGSGSCGKEWNVESGYHTDFSKRDVGSLKCYTHEGTAWLEWTRDDLLVYAYASRRDGDRKTLFTSWNNAGPVE